MHRRLHRDVILRGFHIVLPIRRPEMIREVEEAQLFIGVVFKKKSRDIAVLPSFAIGAFPQSVIELCVPSGEKNRRDTGRHKDRKQDDAALAQDDTSDSQGHHALQDEAVLAYVIVQSGDGGCRLPIRIAEIRQVELVQRDPVRHFHNVVLQVDLHTGSQKQIRDRGVQRISKRIYDRIEQKYKKKMQDFPHIHAFSREHVRDHIDDIPDLLPDNA